MKVVDEKGRLFGIINIIDFAIIALLLVVVGFVGYKAMGSKLNIAPSTGTRNIIVTVKCNSRPEAVAKALKPGDQLISLTNTVDAYIESVEYGPAVEESKKEDGTFILATKPLTKDLTVKIRMNVAATSTITKLGSQDVAIGRYFTIRTKNADTPGIIENIEEK